MGKMNCSVSDGDLKKVLDGEKMLDATFDGINVPYACSVKDDKDKEDIKIGDLSNDILAKRRKELRRVDKCYIVYNLLDNVFSLYHIISFNHFHSDEIYSDEIEVGNGYCRYYKSIDITNSSLYDDVYCDYYEIPIEFYNEVLRMIDVCHGEINGIVRNSLYSSNLYDWDELYKYCHTYKSFCNDGKSRHYCSKALGEMSISEFNNKLSVYNELANDTINKMVKDIKDEFIRKHRYILCDEGGHCYSVRRFDSFCIDKDYKSKEDYGYVKRYLVGNGERIYFVAPSVTNSTYCRVDCSKFSSRFSSLNSSGMGHIYHLSDDSLGDKLFDDYKSIYNKVSEMYDNVSKCK